MGGTPPANLHRVAADDASGHRTAKRIAIASTCASAGLALSNILIGLSVHSSSVLATGVEFAGDVLASSVVLLGVVVAGAPADDNHPYGHGRAETLAAFTVGLILAAGGVGICWQSLGAVSELHPPPPLLAVLSLVVAIAIRGVFSTIKFRAGRRLQSTALLADAWNDVVDILAALVALTAVGLAIYDVERFRTADHYGGFAVGVLVVLIGIRVFREASLDLVDTMPPPERVAEIQDVARSVLGVLGVEKTFARRTGARYHADLHILVDPNLTVAASHAIAGEVRSVLRARVRWLSDVLVHVEPVRDPR